MTCDERRSRPGAGARKARFSIAFVLAVAALALVFHGGLSPNPGSRILTVLGLVETGSLRADRWHDLTIDVALVGGHFYSDKAPLSSFVVLPFYWIWRLAERGPQSALDIQVAVLFGDVLASALPFGAFVLLLYRRAARGIPAPEAILVALLAAFGTSLFSYAGIYFGHALAGALFVYAYDAATRSTPRAAVAGFLVGLAVLTELPEAIGGAFLFAFLVTRPGGIWLGLRYLAGGVPSAIALGVYNARITGSAFDPPYHHLTSIFYQPNPYVLDLHTFAVARDLLVSQYRGAFFYAPALVVLVPLALARAESKARRRLLAGYAAASFVFIASFWVWDGGWCIGPRHFATLFMVLLYEGVDALARSAPAYRLPFFGLASAGLAINLVAAATNPFLEVTRHPFEELYWPAFVRGEIEPHNVFRELGHPLGRASLLAWCALFLFSAWVLARLAPRDATPRG